MSKTGSNMHHGDDWKGRPSFDDPHWYTFVHETIRNHRPDKVHHVALCFECMEAPKRAPRDDDDHPVRCEQCEFNHKRRMDIAASAK